MLLATDTEFRKQEAMLLKAGKRWGRFFMLDADSDGNTVVRERDIADVLAILTDEDETS